MMDFFRRHSYIFIWVLTLVIVGAVAILIFQLNQYVPLVAQLQQEQANRVAAPSGPPAPPPPPSVNLFIQKSATGNSFVVQWAHLPDGAAELEIFRGKTGTDQSTWLLWKTIQLTAQELAQGTISINIGNDTEEGYSFRVEALGENGEPIGSSTSPGETPLWESSSTVPIVTTSTPPSPPENPNPPSNNPPPDQSPSSTNPTPPPNNNPTPPPSSSSSAPNTPSGIPYYNPQIQISSYGQANGNFWVQHANQNIQLGWQDLPDGTDEVIITRSQDQDGPWQTVLTQENPSPDPYSLQIVDDTLGTPYYYEMNAMNGTDTIATYGPVYLASN